MIDRHTHHDPPDAQTLSVYEEMLYAFIFPNTPTTQEEIEVFNAAVLMQYEHDASVSSEADSGLPEGLSSYTVGDFHLAWQPGYNTRTLSRKTICPGVYGLLLRHGLLYRGVEGRR